jgi:hypothetical protein
VPRGERSGGRHRHPRRSGRHSSGCALAPSGRRRRWNTQYDTTRRTRSIRAGRVAGRPVHGARSRANPRAKRVGGHAVDRLSVAGHQFGSDRGANGNAEAPRQGTDVDVTCWLVVNMTFHCFCFWRRFVRSTPLEAAGEHPSVRKTTLCIGAVVCLRRHEVGRILHHHSLKPRPESVGWDWNAGPEATCNCRSAQQRPRTRPPGRIHRPAATPGI